MPSSPRANTKQVAMPCSDLDGVESDTTMLTTLFDPTEWPPLLNLMDNTSTMSTELNRDKLEAKRKRDSETDIEDVENKRTKVEMIDQTSEEEMCPTQMTNERPEKKERRLLEERRNVLRVSVCKMRMIEDPEMFLRRSVLIHNTIRRLQVDMGQENFMKFSQNFVSEQTEANVETDRTSCLVGFLEYQNHKYSQEARAKDFQNNLTDYSEFHDNSDEDSDDEDEDDDDDDDLCISKDYQDDRLGTKEQVQEMEDRMNSQSCMCYHDSWCRQECVRGCTARREGNQCATEYRTIRNSNQGETVFDSVVYHSLLVSLES